MPTPGENETRKDFVDRCIPIVIDEGTAKDGPQAVAICNSMWEDEKKMSESILSTVKLAEGDISKSRVEVLRVGEWDHPKHGRFKITEEKLDNIIRNFNENVRGQNLPVNISHDQTGPAAGWFEGLVREGGRLLADIVWTGLGEKVLKSGEFKFFSSELRDMWRDPESGKAFKDVLFGGALTNIPFIKNMGAIALSEDDGLYALSYTENGDDDIPTNNSTGGTKKMKKIIEMLKLDESADEAAVEEKVEAVVAENDALSGEVEAAGEAADAALGDEAADKSLSEKIKMLADRGKMVEASQDEKDKEIIALSEKVEGLEKKDRKREIEQMFKENEKCVTPAQKEKLTKMLGEGADITMIRELIGTFEEVQAFTEHGHGGTEPADAEKMLSEKAKAIQKEKGVSYQEALRSVE